MISIRRFRILSYIRVIFSENDTQFKFISSAMLSNVNIRILPGKAKEIPHEIQKFRLWMIGMEGMYGKFHGELALIDQK